ncbi:BamA/TamA family outer membrane protein [Fulvivirga sediminis]|uniref:BamA/TamA family outer membrane protein n=1 Tax=Fulvivirga sediminis TaxID=2803949 RepID=A0A937JYA0_9BACT|nr:BamA/TamA family outer membrane protein [Fulvivirga sediminis]MBL3655464.1 BamA/TamA family outer membrane protein [Fulvivirga sediminis]
MQRHYLYKGKAKAYLAVIFIALLTSCKVSEVTHNDSVKQEVIETNGKDSVTVVAGELYKAGKFKRFVLGDHYRDVWLAPVKVPVLNLDSVKGGLEIDHKGGGMQTYSLKVKGGDGQLYSLRSLQKDPTPALPFGLRYSFADDVVQDQISASNPYAAFILPPLGDAAGIYHTNPQLYYIPDTPKLGKFQEDFGGVLAMLEEDADENWENKASFGYTKNAVGTDKVREKLLEDNDDYIDEANLLRNRLFDMWIGDWDRHDGQFRWAELKDDDGDKFYRPIPEDRDNMFFNFDGFLPWWASRKWALRKFQDFQPEVRDIAGLNFNARYLDRRFLTGMSEEEWVDVAHDMQKRLSDEIIEKAVRQFPDTVFQITGERTINILKKRRDNLDEFARRYYKVLAKQVDILGTDQEEAFEIIRHENNDTEVNVYESNGDGKKKRRYYHRVFHNDETKEIRIYGMGDDDYFYLSGKSNDGPLVRIIGGKGEDVLLDSSKVSGLRRKNVYYDDIAEENEIESKGETKLMLSNDRDDNSYDFKEFKYDYLGPALYFGLNNDDGLFLGGGVVIKTQGFRKDPYASMHKIMANYAPGTSAWNFQYEGDFKKLFGDIGMNIDVFARAPNFFTNFYGYGNSSKELNDDDEYYRVRYEEIWVAPGLTHDLGKNSSVKFGPAYQYAKVDDDKDNFFTDNAASLGPDALDASHFGGFYFKADINTTKILAKPEKGVRWITESRWLAELNNDNSRMSKISSELRAYYTLDIPFETTFAVRIGGSSISGDYNFYQASSIGGNAGLSRLGTVRGYGRDRFAGRSSIYQNNEIRMRLLKVPFYYMPFEFGISGHFDQGRVWSDEPENDTWHTGVGGGVWIAPLGRWVFTAVYTVGDYDNMWNVNLGFLF